VVFISKFTGYLIFTGELLAIAAGKSLSGRHNASIASRQHHAHISSNIMVGYFNAQNPLLLKQVAWSFGYPSIVATILSSSSYLPSAICCC
jgi:hypothetical protein